MATAGVCRRLRRSCGCGVEPVLGRAQRQHGGLQLSGRKREGDAQVVLEGPADAEPGPGRQPDPERPGPMTVSAVLIGAGSRHHTRQAAVGPFRLPVGKDVRRSAPAARPGSREGPPAGPEAARRATGPGAPQPAVPPRVRPGPWWSGRRRSAGSGPPPARIQPVRSPAQCDLLSDPMVTTAGLNAASGAVSTPSRFSSRSVSSTTSTVPAAAAARTSRRRWASDISRPVGLWKSGTT